MKLKTYFGLLVTLGLFFCFNGNIYAASVSTISDNFDDNSFNTSMWIDFDGVNFAETNGEWEFTTSTSPADHTVATDDRYDFTNSQMTIKIIDVSGSPSDYASFYFLALNSDWEPYYGWKIQLSTGDIICLGGDASYSATYVANTYRYLRIRGGATALYFDYSSDGKNWTQADTIAAPSELNNLRPVFEWTNGANAAAYVFKVDDFNILPSSSRRIITVS